MPIGWRSQCRTCIPLLLLGTGCRSIDEQVDAAGALLMVLYGGFCALQFALPRLHAWPAFQLWRAHIRQFAFGLAVVAFGFGAVRLIVALRAEHLPMVHTGIAAVCVAIGMWLLLWTRAATKEDQAKFAKLVAFSVSVLIGLFYLLHSGSRLFGWHW